MIFQEIFFVFSGYKRNYAAKKGLESLHKMQLKI